MDEYRETKVKNICKVMLTKSADLLKDRRINKNLSIRMLSELSGVSTAVISDFENKKYLPKMDILVRLALILDVPINKLLAFMQPDEHLERFENIVKVESNSFITTFLLAQGVANEDVEEIKDFIDFKKQRKNNKKN